VKHPAQALASLLARVAKALGPEGAFLLVGTVLLAVGAGVISPAGPWLVVGGVSLLIGLALAVPVPPKKEP
jgi:hypothetical protein